MPELVKEVIKKMVALQECFKPHPTAHAVTGLGIGLLLAGLFTGLAGSTGIVAGIILIVISLAWHFVMK